MWDAGTAVTAIPAAGDPSGKRITPDRTPVPTGRPPIIGIRVAGTKLEKSIASTIAPALTVTTRAIAASRVPG